MPAHTPLTSVELEQLSSLLASDDLADALPLDAVQGALYAMASGPGEFPASAAWLPLVLGERADGDDAARASADALLQRFADECRRDIQQADDSLPLLLFDDNHGKPDYATWCQGYLDGIAAAEPAWDASADADDVADLLLPIEVLAAERDEAPATFDAIDDIAAYRREVRADFAGVLLDIRQYWFDRRTSRVPVTRDAPKVGRNDRCPCGSGRKFKQCHGAADAPTQ